MQEIRQNIRTVFAKCLIIQITCIFGWKNLVSFVVTKTDQDRKNLYEKCIKWKSKFIFGLMSEYPSKLLESAAILLKCMSAVTFNAYFHREIAVTT